jgi:hypothetical protein
MTQYWHGMKQAEQDGMLIVVDRTYCDIDPADLFDDEHHNISEIREKINNGFYEWFDLRVRVTVEGLEVGCSACCGFLYENPMDVFEDGTAQDLIDEAVADAQSKFYALGRKFSALAEMVDN